MPHSTDLPNLLVIAGLDPSGGAGLLADARVAERHGFRAVGVVTGLTEQDTHGVRRANPVPPEIVSAQLRALLSDVAVAAVKIGMLASEAIAAAVADALALTAAPVVWDPVLLPTRGRVALYEGSTSRAVQLLMPHVRVATPNLAEAAALLGRGPIADVDGARAAARALTAAGMEAVLVTGGHLTGDDRGTDVLAFGDVVVEVRGEWIAGDVPVHGTGCALSSALACALARGDDLPAAVRAAKQFVADRLRAPAHPGRGMPSVM
ncbi:MAG: bifunctional hydroxymethylpyrimidine kinase/phosphomethylpyrimidine kinase [Deltaproteobacteria bacterium]|nr:MAG: bifunctional hydroxymethylpyrimidine kinase/phosphomethylpyrimidine kinase [Deltaproteobacteria bacterium]